MMKRFLAGLLLSLGGILPVAAQSTAPGDSTVHVYRTVADTSLRAYVFAPNADGTARSGILLFHGGGWSRGTPRWMFDAARRFASHGMVAISIQYRLSDADTTPIEAFTDACAAFRWARGHAGELGIAPDRLAGYGVSAGGHLVASTATVGCPPPNDGEKTATPRAAPDVLLLWSPAVDVVQDDWFRQQLQGRAPAAKYSPVEHIGEATPPTSIVQGDADTVTPLSGAKRYCKRLRKTGTACDLNVYEGLGHLLTRNLETQVENFDPDPEAVADGRQEHLQFLRKRGFISEE